MRSAERRNQQIKQSSPPAVVESSAVMYGYNEDHEVEAHSGRKHNSISCKSETTMMISKPKRSYSDSWGEGRPSTSSQLFRVDLEDRNKRSGSRRSRRTGSSRFLPSKSFDGSSCDSFLLNQFLGIGESDLRQLNEDSTSAMDADDDGDEDYEDVFHQEKLMVTMSQRDGFVLPKLQGTRNKKKSNKSNNNHHNTTDDIDSDGKRRGRWIGRHLLLVLNRGRHEARTRKQEMRAYNKNKTRHCAKPKKMRPLVSEKVARPSSGLVRL